MAPVGWMLTAQASTELRLAVVPSWLLSVSSSPRAVSLCDEQHNSVIGERVSEGGQQFLRGVSHAGLISSTPLTTEKLGHFRLVFIIALYHLPKEGIPTCYGLPGCQIQAGASYPLSHCFPVALHTWPDLLIFPASSLAQWTPEHTYRTMVRASARAISSI